MIRVLIDLFLVIQEEEGEASKQRLSGVSSDTSKEKMRKR